jgi:transposase
MAKYGRKFKLMLVREYQEGKLGYNPLAEKYGMKSSAQLKRWVKIYEKFGVEGLMRKKHKESLLPKLKKKVEQEEFILEQIRNKTVDRSWVDHELRDKGYVL